MQEVFDYIDAHLKEYIDELFGMLRIGSISTINKDVSKMAEHLAGIMKSSGVEKVEIIPTKRHPVVYGEIIVDPSYPTQLVYGHYDVQPPEPFELWKSDPFDPVIRDGRIYARGSSDNKGQLHVYLKALEAYRKVTGGLPVNMKFLFEGEEEIGSENLEEFVRGHLDLLSCDYCVYSDGHMHDSNNPVITLGHKGMMPVEIKLHGANRDTHSQRAGAIPNPLWRMAHLLASMRAPDSAVCKIEGFYDDVRKPTPLELEACAKVPCDNKAIAKNYGLDHLLQNRTGDSYYYNLMFEPTCNLSGMFGGYTGKGSKTVLPNEVTAKLDFRLVPDMEPQDIIAKLKSHLEKHGFGDAELTVFEAYYAGRTDIEDPYVEIVRKAICAGWGVEPYIFPSTGGCGPHYIFTKIMGIPYICIPLGYADQNNHAPNENLAIDAYVKGIKTAAAVIDHVGGK